MQFAVSTEIINILDKVNSAVALVTVFDPRIENQQSNQIFNGIRSTRLNQFVNQAKKNVLHSVNGTINRLKSGGSEDTRSMRDLFALAKFPPRKG